MTTPKVTIIGSALSGNKGAAAMLESSIQTLSDRLPGVEFTLFSMYPKADSKQNVYSNLEIVAANPRQLGITINLLGLIYRVLPPLRPLLRSRSKSIGALTGSQVLLDQGGITFTDGREKFLLYNVASILPALFVRTPVFKCAQAIGPFSNVVNRSAAKVFLPRVDTVVTRGSITHGYATELGLKNLHAGADYAFSLELAGTERDELAPTIDLDFFASRGVVGISPSVVLQKKVDSTGGDYAGTLVAFIDRLTESGHRAMLIPHSVRTGTVKTHNNDLPLCRDIYSRLANPNRILFIDRELPSQQLRYLIGQCEFFVASRFHAMVSSLAMSVPTLVIGWSHKYQEVLEMFELEEWALGHELFDLDHLTTRFADLLASEKPVAMKLARHLPVVKARSREQADLIAALVNSRL